MQFYEDERVALFIDGSNLYATAKALGFDIDYKRMLGVFRKRSRLIRAIYYTALMEDAEYSPLRPLIDWLDYNGFKVVTKPAKEFTDSLGRRKIKGNMDIEIAVEMMQLADNLDHIVLFSVSVVSTLTTRPPMVADELRRAADQFIDLADFRSEIGRDPAERPPRAPMRPVTPGGEFDEFDDN